MSAPLTSLIEFDLLRLREFARRLKGDAWSAAVVVLIGGGGVAGLVVGLERLGRVQLAGHAGLAAAAGAGLGVFIVMAQRRAVVRLADGPFGPVLADPRLRTAWSAVRVAAAALLPAGAMAAGAVIGGDVEAALAVFGGLALAAALALAAPVLSVDLPFRGERPAPARADGRTGAPVWLALRSPAAGLPRWAWVGAAAAACAVLARLALANGNPAAAHGLLFAGAWACGALAAPSPDLFVFLARTPRSLERLLVDFAAAPAAVGLLAGVASIAVPGAGLGGAAAVVAGVLACGLSLAVVHLNQLAYGPVAGPPRLGIYTALAAVAASALGPFVVLFVAGGLALLARTAARRRWSAA